MITLKVHPEIPASCPHLKVLSHLQSPFWEVTRSLVPGVGMWMPLGVQVSADHPQVPPQSCEWDLRVPQFPCCHLGYFGN